ncbi:MAG: PBP1A family penicillin-binding protein [Deltaproteobacteria bacterium]|nr:PBP1A family penicillin-binding protein [Deltaproteobacteria bacterium]
MEYEPIDENRPESPLNRLRHEQGWAQHRPTRLTPSEWMRQPWVRRLLPALGAVLLGIVGGIAVAAAIRIPQVDTLEGFTPSRITRVHSSDGQIFAEFARQKRILLDENELPEMLQHAIVALEDKKFFRHGGVDATGILRAALTNMRHGRKKEGASTITMQLARALYLTPEKSWSRKIEEAFTAVELEKRYSKQQLLTLYCNIVNLGHGNYGMAQAARFFFDKTVGELELHEAAMLAGIPQRPSDYSPYRRQKKVLERRNHVLNRMLAEGYISETEHRDATAKGLGVITQQRKTQIAPYFAEDVRKMIESRYGTQAMLEGGLQVYTTLDTQIQASAEQALRDGLIAFDHRKGWRGAPRHLEEDPTTVQLDSWPKGELEVGRWYEGVVLSSDRKSAQVRIGKNTYELTPEGMKWTRRRRPDQVLETGDVAFFHLEPGKEESDEPRLFLDQEPEAEGAVVVLESANGAVRGLVGGWDFSRSKFNRVTQARRQVGSAFKLFVWGAALEAGYTAADTIFDAPTYFAGSDNTPNYRPRNFGRKYYGIVTLRRAFEKSMNMTAVKLMDMVGVDSTIDFARRCGVEGELLPYPSLALGVAELTPLETVAAFASIANQGTYVRPRLIERVESANGGTLDEFLPETSFATTPETAFVLGSILKGVVDRGTATSMRKLEVELAGKTGTTDDFSDAWFVGFTPRYTILSWVGYDRRRSLGRGMTGSEAALPIWKQLIESGLETGWVERNAKFSPPPGINLVPVERYTGLLPTPGAEQVIVEAFLQGTEPARSYEPLWEKVMELPWYQQRPFYLPKERERMPEEFEDVAREDNWTDQDG